MAFVLRTESKRSVWMNESSFVELFDRDPALSLFRQKLSSALLVVWFRFTRPLSARSPPLPPSG